MPSAFAAAVEPVLRDPERRLDRSAGARRTGGGRDPADPTGEQRTAIRVGGLDPGLEPVAGRLWHVARRDGGVDGRDGGLLGGRGERRFIDPEVGGERLPEGRAVLGDLGGAVGGRAGGGRRGRTGARDTGGAVAAATDPMMVPPTSAATTRRPANPASRNEGIGS